jgi:hypothetical protein
MIIGYARGVDTLKMLATVKPTSFRELELPPIDQPIPPFQSRNAEDSPGATTGYR